MAKGYWIVRVDVADQEKYKAYVAANAAPLRKYGARFLVRAGKYENPEGGSRGRNAVIEFPELPGGARLLEIAGVPGRDQAARAGLDDRSHRH